MGNFCKEDSKELNIDITWLNALTFKLAKRGLLHLLYNGKQKQILKLFGDARLIQNNMYFVDRVIYRLKD